MNEVVGEIYSLLVPLAGSRLLVPRACVAEIAGFMAPTAMPGAPPWYLGVVVWTGRQAPLVSFEGLCGEPIPEVSSRSRIVLFNAIGERLDSGVFGIVAQGFPQLVRVGVDVIRPDTTYAVPEQYPILCRVRMMNETPRIPDLERLEALIANETSAVAS